MKTKGRFAKAAGTFSSSKGQVSPAGSPLNALHGDLPMTSARGDSPEVPALQLCPELPEEQTVPCTKGWRRDSSRTCGYPRGDTTSMGHLLKLSSQLPFAVPASSSDMLWEAREKNLSEPLPSHSLSFCTDIFMLVFTHRLPLLCSDNTHPAERVKPCKARNV